MTVTVNLNRNDGEDAPGPVDVDTMELVFKVQVTKVTGLTVTGATLVTAKFGAASIDHYVTAKQAGATVTITATISPNTQAIRDTINWTGATEDAGNPLVATVSKAAAARFIVTIVDSNLGMVLKEFRVWIVWATASGGTPTNTSAIALQRQTVADQHTPSQQGPGVNLTSAWSFQFTIAPTSLFVDDDRPNLEGNKSGGPPGGVDVIQGQALSGGATLKWDVSRRTRIKIISQNVGTAWYSVAGGTVFNNLPSGANGVVEDDFPTNDAVGNDDPFTTGEDNNPGTDGVVSSTDDPSLPVIRDAGGTVGDTVELRFQNGEFVRLEIEGTWTRVSDFAEWRHHAKLIKKDEAVDDTDYNGDLDKVDQLWVNNGSVSDATNDGW